MKTINKKKSYCLLIAQNFLFKGVDVSTVDFAFQSDQCFCLEFELGEKIYTRNNFYKSLGIVLSGELKALKSAGTSTILNSFYRGDVFGVAGLFNDASQYVSEVVVVKRSRVLFLSQELLQSLFEKNAQIAQNYIGYLTSRICFLNSRIDNFTGGTAECRLANFLLSFCEESGSSCSFELPCTWTQLSNTLGIGRASLYRAIEILSDANIIKRNGKNVSIIDIERLKSGKFRS